MKKVLYLTNIETPYRVRFFNELAKKCDLTVLYERKKSSNRNAEWSTSENGSYRAKYLHGIEIKGENTFSVGILKEVFSPYDAIIVGCYNSPVQMMAMLAMRLFGINFIINLDGEPFLSGDGLKTKLKKFFLSGTDRYLVAGEKTAQSLKKIFSNVKVYPYYFSSLSEAEIQEHRKVAENCQRNDTILVVGQYFDYKGMDVALEAARLSPDIQYKFVGMGFRTELFMQEHDVPKNVEIIPFLQKQELEKEYLSCAMLVLPSRQECWGLVINEAASFGMPIVSTWGSGAAVEFLVDEYPQFLANPGDSESLRNCVQLCINMDKQEYSNYLIEKTVCYSVDRSVKEHLLLLG